MQPALTAGIARPEPKPTLYRVLFLISLVHLFNDSIQAVFPAIYPILKDSMALSYTKIGLLTFALNFTASIMQPIVGAYTDTKPSPYLLPLGMVFTFAGMLTLAFADNYTMIFISVLFVGLGSAVFHPEGSRVSYMAAGARRGLAQSIYQVGGNAGQALAPLMAIFIFYRLGLSGAAWFTLVAAAAIGVQFYIARWYRNYMIAHPPKPKVRNVRPSAALTERKRQVTIALYLLVFLVFVRSWYHAAISNYYSFYAIENFGISKETAQYFIFAFLAAGALGTLLGGPLADRFGRRNILFFSMLGSAPFAILLPYAGPVWAFVLLLVIGFIVLSSFSVSVVYAQELMPGKIGTVSGLIVGLAFGMGALGAVALGKVIDLTSITFMMTACGFLPLMGILTMLLPSDRKIREWNAEMGEE
ncbi:MFS transporter [Paenibacillus sp. J2TS4]|uniref:MFS transporter n=1 Tax=Paenibacillus sp. J2TS4 TaxID=2807194 RepID=UPI001B01AAE6|nr:MFS transporter [Paenibacillus sp. J2TS4]GIP31257.1 MFS transporter [Paenibacillus sp. J2TS4]